MSMKLTIDEIKLNTVEVILKLLELNNKIPTKTVLSKELGISVNALNKIFTCPEEAVLYTLDYIHNRVTSINKQVQQTNISFNEKLIYILNSMVNYCSQSRVIAGIIINQKFQFANEQMQSKINSIHKLVSLNILGLMSKEFGSDSINYYGLTMTFITGTFTNIANSISPVNIDTVEKQWNNLSRLFNK